MMDVQMGDIMTQPFKSGDILLKRNKFTMETECFLVIEEVYDRRYNGGKGYKLWDFEYSQPLTLGLDSITLKHMIVAE